MSTQASHVAQPQVPPSVREVPVDPKHADGAVELKPANNGCEALIDAKQAAEILDISPTKVKRMAQAGELPAIQIGNRWKFRPSWLDAWLNSHVPLAGHPRPSKEV